MQRKFPLCYETYGNSKHPCIILITGIGGQLIQWPKSFIEGLVKHNLCVVIFDNRDSGESQSYDHLGAPDIAQAMQEKQAGTFKPPYTFKDMADDVLMLMNKLSIQKAHILGSSMGGMIAQSFALNHPEQMLSLILIATSSGDSHLPPPKPEVLQFFSPQLSNNKEDLESYVDNKSKLFKIYDPYFFNEEKSRTLFEKLYKRSASPVSFKRQLLVLLAEEPRGDKLKKVTVNSLIVHGDNDPAFPPEHGKYLHEILPNSRLEIIEKMGHLLSDELSEKIVHIIAGFIKDTLTGEPIKKFSMSAKL